MPNISKNKIFIISSFNEKYLNTIQMAIKPAIEDAGYSPTIADGSEGGRQNIFKDIENKIFDSYMCIADISIRDDHSGKPIDLKNIFYEIACAQTIQKHVILLCTDPKKELPYDLSHLRVTTYNPDNLMDLKEKIIHEIQNFQESSVEKVFSKVKFMTDDLQKQFEDLKNNAIKMRIDVTPPIADIFLNDKRLGASPQTFYINPSALRNTISIAAPAYFEEHIVLSEEDYAKKSLSITLQQVPKDDDVALNDKRTYGWLINRRKDPDNPVLMRAIAQFLVRSSRKVAKKTDKIQYSTDAKNELEELLRVAPGWYMAHNQMGIFYIEDFEKSLHHYKVATALNPKNYLGYFNQACAYARNKMYDKVFEILETFNNSDEIIKSYSYSNMRLQNEEAFDTLKTDALNNAKFLTLVSEIDTKAKNMKEQRQ